MLHKLDFGTKIHFWKKVTSNSHINGFDTVLSYSYFVEKTEMKNVSIFRDHKSQQVLEIPFIRVKWDEKRIQR